MNELLKQKFNELNIEYQSDETYDYKLANDKYLFVVEGAQRYDKWTIKEPKEELINDNVYYIFISTNNNTIHIVPSKIVYEQTHNYNKNYNMWLDENDTKKDFFEYQDYEHTYKDKWEYLK